MSDSWYYVQKGQRLGPVDLAAMAKLIHNKDLGAEDYVWKKGFENWLKLRDVSELTNLQPASAPSATSIPATPNKTIGDKFQFRTLNADENVIYLRIGMDRGGIPVEYGPYSASVVKKLYQEHRINGRTEFFVSGKTKSWMFLADVDDFEEEFHDVPPVIQEAERRRFIRKPLMARLFIQNNKKVFEGVCRDISIGGMQVLTDTFPGKAGDRISINVHPDNTDYHFTANGQVVRVLEGSQGFSFRFDPLEAQAQKAIEKYIRDAESAG